MGSHSTEEWGNWLQTKGIKMSKDWVKDINEMQTKYGLHEKMEEMTENDKKHFLIFRHSCLEEELGELSSAIAKEDKEEIVDALIDLIVFAVGTLDAFKIDGSLAWDEVLRANMNKKTGIKETRPNPFGFPDLIKPSDWKEPSHKGNTGIL
jgi:predicted HAD superfamily Cof-like phosphohydrolase